MPIPTKQLPPKTTTQTKTAPISNPKPIQSPALEKFQSTSLAKFQSAWDFIDYLKILVYGKSGTGKTVFWSSFPKPILAIIISGSKKPGELKSLDPNKFKDSIVPLVCNSSEQLTEMLENSDQFPTKVLDHASGLQDLVLKEILGLEEIPVGKPWGLATQAQYGQCVMKCKEILRKFLNLNGHTVIIGQESKDRSEGTDSEIILPTIGVDLTPKLAAWLNPACDYIVQTYLRPNIVTSQEKIPGSDEVTEVTTRKGVQFCLRTEKHDVYTTKFRVPVGFPLPPYIHNPTYDKIAKLLKGQKI